MPYKTYMNWLFDGNKTSPIPPAQGNVDILKYNSPITHTFALQMFIKHGPLNQYLNKYFNDINVRYLEKHDLFLFLKKCVLDFRILRRDIVFYPYKAKNKLYDKLREKIPQLKNNDIELLVEMIEKSDDRNVIYDTLGLAQPPKKQIKLGKNKIDKQKKISLKSFIEKHFSTIKE